MFILCYVPDIIYISCSSRWQIRSDFNAYYKCSRARRERRHPDDIRMVVHGSCQHPYPYVFQMDKINSEGVAYTFIPDLFGLIGQNWTK